MSLAGLRSLHELLLVYSSSNEGNNLADHHQEDWPTKNGVGGSGPEKKSSTNSAPFTLSALPVNVSATPTTPLSKPAFEEEIWPCTWTVWMRIAMTSISVSNLTIDSQPTTNQNNRSTSSTSGSSTEDRRYSAQQSLQHRQQFLTALLQIFPLIFTHIKTK